MKYLSYISLILFSASALVGCKDEGNYRPFTDTQVVVVQSNVSFTSTGGTGKIEIDPAEGTVTAASDQSWCTAAVSGHTVTVTVGENPNLEPRMAQITLTSGEKVSYVPVYQSPLKIEVEEYNIGLAGYTDERILAYECQKQITITSDKEWLTATIEGNSIKLEAPFNPSLTDIRKARITLKTVEPGGDGESTEGSKYRSAIEYIYVTQSPLQPEPTEAVLNDFLTVNNYDNGNSSRYRISFFSPALNQVYQALNSAYPGVIQEMRIQAPRSTYKISVFFYNIINNGSAYYYWNATNGLVPVSGSKSVAWFNFSGNSYATATPPYQNDARHAEFRAIFASANGFTIIPVDGEENSFWFRSQDNPAYYFKATPY